MNIQLKAHREMFSSYFLRQAESMVTILSRPHHGNCSSNAMGYRPYRTQQNEPPSSYKSTSPAGSNSMSAGVKNGGYEVSGDMNHQNSGISPASSENAKIGAGFRFSAWSRQITSNILESI
ncbi:MAG: hypothetical protein M1304_04580 [Candidatus Thermoplasmatota archaeon]|jgi:hypothetical protein|nr:hypothetical protein [Candidatus Thermoplasmatota archaeon]MCL5732265.1 hypothetical protein [Candidatus Thermoplasmatota archaeon]